MPDFLPRRENQLLAWAKNFLAQILPDPEAFNLSEQLAEDFSLAFENFADVYAITSKPLTRSRVDVARKNDALRELKRQARMLAGIVRASIASNQELISLGLRERAPAVRRIATPTTTPQVTVLSVRNGTVELRLADKESLTSRAKPRGTLLAAIYSYIGDQPPTESSQWQYRHDTSKLKTKVIFEEIAPGAQVWFTAAWKNPTGQPGPSGNVIGTRVQGPTMILMKNLQAA